MKAFFQKWCGDGISRLMVALALAEQFSWYCLLAINSYAISYVILKIVLDLLNAYGIRNN